MKNPHFIPDTCAFLVELTELAFISSKARRENAEELVNLHLSVMQGKTSFLQIVIHSFLPFFHCVYILFC